MLAVASAMEVRVKQEIVEQSQSAQSLRRRSELPPLPEELIELSDSDSDDDADAISAKRTRDSFVNGGFPAKKQNVDGNGASPVVFPLGFLDPLAQPPAIGQACKQFWKAGDFEGSPYRNCDSQTGGMDHVRVHPKFLHSNATSHKWALGAFAELLDNSLDEVCNGATYVNIDMLINRKDVSRMLLIEDNGGGMDPDKLRQCMSLGYSVKGKLANTIGQYGNGFKTSTMRLGADVIVFSRSCGKDSKSVTQSVGLLSYTFLRSTGKEDIVVPIALEKPKPRSPSNVKGLLLPIAKLDYERKEREWNKILRSSADDWGRNMDTIINWSPYSSEAELLEQFNLIENHGTRIIIYNLWEDDQGQLELDFGSDQHDIQIRGVNRDEKNIQMAKQYPNSRHFLTYRHSLRSYVSILYLRLPPNFRIILRGKDVEHHDVVNDMMMTEEVTYRPQSGADGLPKDINMFAVVTVGFVKDAAAHIDVEGFNVYHKNRLIKPFWRLWNTAGSDGRGVIGVLEANFVEPAHDKQGFERTTVLARLENKLVHMQRTYWRNYCHKIGYAPRYNKELIGSGGQESLPEYTTLLSNAKKKGNTNDWDKFNSCSSLKQGGKTARKYVSVNEKCGNGLAYHGRDRESSAKLLSSSTNDTTDDFEQDYMAGGRVNGINHPTQETPQKVLSETTYHSRKSNGVTQQEVSISSGVDTLSLSDLQTLNQLQKENRELKERLEREEGGMLADLLRDLQNEKDKRKVLEIKLQEAECKIEELNREQETLIDIFTDERDRRDLEEETLRKRLRDASNPIEGLREKVRLLEKTKSLNGK